MQVQILLIRSLLNEFLRKFFILIFVNICCLNYMKAAMNIRDGIIDTVSVVHSIKPLLGLLKSHQGKLFMIGLPDKPLELPIFSLVLGNSYIT